MLHTSRNPHCIPYIHIILFVTHTSVKLGESVHDVSIVHNVKGHMMSVTGDVNMITCLDSVCQVSPLWYVHTMEYPLAITGDCEIIIFPFVIN